LDNEVFSDMTFSNDDSSCWLLFKLQITENLVTL
jgi:hypothetical protein